jgi:hypothetical protein
LIEDLLFGESSAYPEDELVALLIDDEAPQFHRFLAMRALAGRGNSAGYCGVVAAAVVGANAEWFRAFKDDRYAWDDTFPQLARAVGTSREAALRNDSEPRRIDAVRALVRRADELYFDVHLADALDEHTLPHVAHDLAEAIARGIDKLGEPRSFDLAEQIADLLAALRRVDESSAALLENHLRD